MFNYTKDPPKKKSLTDKRKRGNINETNLFLRHLIFSFSQFTNFFHLSKLISVYNNHFIYIYIYYISRFFRCIITLQVTLEHKNDDDDDGSWINTNKNNNNNNDDDKLVHIQMNCHSAPFFFFFFILFFLCSIHLYNLKRDDKSVLFLSSQYK
jgi:hypothetical protein